MVTVLECLFNVCLTLALLERINAEKCKVDYLEDEIMQKPYSAHKDPSKKSKDLFDSPFWTSLGKNTQWNIFGNSIGKFDRLQHALKDLTRKVKLLKGDTINKMKLDKLTEVLEKLKEVKTPPVKNEC